MPETDSVEIQQPVEPKPTDWPKMILITVLGTGFLISAALIGYWCGVESSRPKSQIRETLTPKPAPVVESETKDWKIYRDETSGYLVKYPSSLEIFTEVDEKLELTNFKASEAAHGVFIPKKGFHTIINVQSIEEAIEDFAEGSPYEAEGYEKIYVGGRLASKITSKVELGPDTFLRTIVFYVSTDSYTYVLRFSFYEEDAWEFTPLVDQILRTFKFLD